MYMGVCTNHQKAIKYCATNVVLTLALIQIIKTRLVFRIILYEHTNVYIETVNKTSVILLALALSRKCTSFDSLFRQISEREKYNDPMNLQIHVV